MPSHLADVDALRAILEILTPFDAAERARILRWAGEKFDGADADSIAPPRPTLLDLKPAPDADLEPVWSRQRTDRPGPAARATDATSPVDIKAFLRAARPVDDAELVTAIAYYYKFAAAPRSRRDHVSEADVVRACSSADRKRPARPRQALIEAAARGLLERKARSQYRLSLQGESRMAGAVLAGRPATVRAAARAKTAKQVPATERPPTKTRARRPPASRPRRTPR